MTAGPVKRTAMPEAKRIKNRRNAKCKTSDTLRHTNLSRGTSNSQHGTHKSKVANKHRKEQKTVRQRDYDWKNGERIGEAKKPGPPPVSTYCEAQQGGGRCPGFPPSAKMRTCVCGKKIHFNCNRDHNCDKEVGEARKLGPTTTKAVRVGRHEFFRVRAMKLENEWAAIIDADGSRGELRTGDQLHRIGITKMKEYFESAAWKQAITDKKQEKRFAVMKKRIHENMSDTNGGTEWV